MRRVFLDTNAYAALRRGDPEALRVIEAAPALGLSITVIGELLDGFRGGQREQVNLQALRRFLVSPRVILAPVDMDTADWYATISQSLRAGGTPIPTNDIWIAASVLRHQGALFTLDGHFRHVEGLCVGATWAELRT